MIDINIRRPVRVCLASAAAVSIAACATAPAATTQAPEVTIPQAVVDIADPRQNLFTARLREADKCYWYEHNNPLETTLLPLLTVDGRPICVR